MNKTQMDPGRNFVEVDPSDTALFKPCRGIYVGTSGDLAIEGPDNEEVTFVGIASGVIHPIRAIRVLDTGTTADDLVLVY